MATHEEQETPTSPTAEGDLDPCPTLLAQVIGVGSAGISAVKLAVERGLDPSLVCLVDTNWDQPTKGFRTLSLCRNGLPGAGSSNESEGRIDSLEGLLNLVQGQDLLIVVAGLSGETVSLVAPIFAGIEKKQDAITFVVVAENVVPTNPLRSTPAKDVIEELLMLADCVVVVDAAQPDTTVFLSRAVLALVQMVFSGIISSSFEDMRIIFRSAGLARVGVGWADGEHRGRRAAQAAISSLPHGRLAVFDAFHVLITADPALRMREIDEAITTLYDRISDERNVIFQATCDESVEGFEVTIIGARIDELREPTGPEHR